MWMVPLFRILRAMRGDGAAVENDESNNGDDEDNGGEDSEKKE